MASNIQQVGRVHATDDMSGVDTPGALTAFEDQTAIVCGDGKLTPTDATSAFINYLAKTDPGMTAFAGQPSAATFGAQLMLQRNQQLSGLGADSAIPRGERFNMDGMTLKQALAPFASRLDELREFVAQSSGGVGMDAGTNKVMGNTRAPARGIPII
jgi:hypothetical protein